jgi:periodic tryptophan protein 2
MQFTPNGVLITGSWDRTIRVWNVFDRKANFYALEHTTEVLSISVHPNGRNVAVATDNGNITYWDLEEE